MKEYEINKETLAIVSLSTKESLIKEVNREIKINLSSQKIINDSCKYFGSSFQGRLEGTKKMIGVTHKAPIIVDEMRNLIFFPTTSFKNANCIWFSLNNIKDYFQEKDDVYVIFKNGEKIKIDVSFGTLDNQILRAAKLELTLRKRKEKYV